MFVGVMATSLIRKFALFYFAQCKEAFVWKLIYVKIEMKKYSQNDGQLCKKKKIKKRQDP